MTTEPGAPLNSPAPPTSLPDFQLPDIQIPGLPRPTRSTPLPTVPAPANASTMTCSEYLELDEATRLAVVNAVLKDDSGALGSMGGNLAKTMTDMACEWVPDLTVSQVLTAGG